MKSEFIFHSQTGIILYGYEKIKRFALLLIMASFAVNVQAQLEQAVKKIFAGDTVATHPTSLRRDSDSARVANLQKSLEEARLNEANMRMEMEQMRLQTMAADSVKLSQQRQRIDSLRQFTKGVPVIAEGDTLFYLFTKRGGVDGGVGMPLVPLPEEIPFPHGKIVYILTRDVNYRKKPVPFWFHGLLNAVFGRQYPAVVKGMCSIPERYNEKVEKVLALEREGSVFVIRPDEPVTVSRTERDAGKLRKLHGQGYRLAMDRFEEMKRWLHGE